jgi:hypothetical protein
MPLRRLGLKIQSRYKDTKLLKGLETSKQDE